MANTNVRTKEVAASFRFTREALELLKRLAAREGRTRTGYLEWLIRQQAKTNGLFEEIEK